MLTSRASRSISIFQILYDFLIVYPAPINLTFLWNFGFYATFCLIVQILSGLFLSMHYIGNIMDAFISVEEIMRDVNNGWLIRYMHANVASFFFIAVYLHIARGLYFFSYVRPRQLLWLLGVIIFFLMIIAAFLGYVLPWGQMSFWGATVITNLVSVIPKVGTYIVVWIWGGFAIAKATLTRFYTFHFLFPFLILLFVIYHFIILHETGSNNPLGIEFKGKDGVNFFPYYIIKDLFGIYLFVILISFFINYNPNALGHTDNYIDANPLVTPSHIVPEWYLLPFYAILRGIPDKLFGAIALVLAIFVLAFLPFYIWQPAIRSTNFRFYYRVLFWFIFFNTIILGWLGSQPAASPFVEFSQLGTILYFSLFLLFLPLISLLDTMGYLFYQRKYILREVFKKNRRFDRNRWFYGR